MTVKNCWRWRPAADLLESTLSTIVALLIITAVALVFLTGCERRTAVKLSPGYPPTFVISGSGALGEVTITKPVEEQTNDPLDDQNIVWKIVALKPPGEHVEVLGSITYGVIPAGYRQILPRGGSAPPLLEDKRYGYLFVTSDAPHASGYFQIHDGRASVTEPPSSPQR